VAKIKNQNKLLGDFTLFFKDGDYLRNRSIFQLFLTQLGLFIEKIRLEQALKVSQSRFFTLAEYAPVGFVSCDLDGKIIYANKKILDMLNTPSLEEMRAVNLFESSSFEKLGFSEKLSECMEMDKGITYEIGYKSIWGKDSWLRIHYNPHKENGHIVGANIIVDDITDIKAKEVTLKEQALRDPLTNAYNRYALDTIVLDRLNESKEEQLIDCFALVNVDNFKEINDNYGHEVGDRVLKYLTTRVIKEFRGNDLVVRTGGDEFLIYFHDIKQVENANCVIERLFHKISTKYRFIDDMDGSCYGINVSCSIGVSIYPKDGNSLNELMSKADIALSHIKKSGKSNYYIEA
jgi:diguanylate cyclase (GGDEF)-like protein/PAS domain S-box-containing protein